VIWSPGCWSWRVVAGRSENTRDSYAIPSTRIADAWATSGGQYVVEVDGRPDEARGGGAAGHSPGEVQLKEWAALFRAVAHLAWDCQHVGGPPGEARRGLVIVRAQLPRLKLLTDDVVYLVAGIDPALAADLVRFVDEELPRYVGYQKEFVDAIWEGNSKILRDYDLQRVQRDIRESYSASFHELVPRVMRLPGVRGTLERQMSFNQEWEALGFSSESAFDEAINPSMASLANPDDLTLWILRQLLERPLPIDLSDEGIPVDTSSDIFNRLWRSKWIERPESDAIKLTRVGADLLRSRLAAWSGGA
jgi:hypothetical protein